MKKQLLGRTELMVSELCLGTMNFGWKLHQQKAFEILDAYYEAGGNFFQAIGTYPDTGLLPAPEEWLGEWIESRKIPRDKIVLTSRIILPKTFSLEDDALATSIEEYCHTSLQRLRSDHVDLLFLEWSRSLLPLEHTLSTLEALQQKQVFRYIASANFPLWRIPQCLHISPDPKSSMLRVVQSEYSLLSSLMMEENLIDLLQDYELGFIASASLSGGILSARTPPVGTEQRKEALLQRIAATADAHNASLAETALSWVLSNPQVSSAVISVNSVNQLSELIQATTRDISSEAFGRARKHFLKRDSIDWG